VHQTAGHVAERPPIGGKHVRRRRRNDDDERQVGDGEIQQQEVGDGAHAFFGRDDVNDKSVADDAERRHYSVQYRNGDLVQKESE